MPWDSVVYLESYYEGSPQTRQEVQYSLRFSKAAMYRPQPETREEVPDLMANLKASLEKASLEKVCAIPDCGCTGLAHA